MAAVADARPPRERLDPLALPADTPFRFALLVAAVVGSTMYVYDWLYLREVLSPATFAAQAQCFRVVQADFARAASAGLVPPRQDCFGLDPDLAPFTLAGTFAVLLVAGAVFLALPRWRILRGHFVALPSADIPGLDEALSGLVREAGLRERPTFLFEPLRAAPGGLAFGRPGRRYVALSGGLVTTYLTDPALFRGILRHELSHLRNGDLDQTYGAIAITTAFTLVAGVPFAISFARHVPAQVPDVLLRFGVLAAFVALTLAAVLRSRELFADAAAARHDADGGLRRALGTGGRKEPRLPALALHPTAGARLRALDDPAALFSTSPWTALAAGFAAALALETVQATTLSLTGDASAAVHVAALAFAPLVAAVAGIGIWRDAYRSLATGAAPERVVLAGVALAAGIVGGRETSLDGLVSPSAGVLSRATLEHVLSGWSLATVVAAVLLLRWLWSVAAMAQRSALAERRPRLAPVVATGLATLVVWLLLEVLLLAQALYGAAVTVRATLADDYANASTLVATGPRWLWTLLESALSTTVSGRTATFVVLLALAAGPFALAVRPGDRSVRFPPALRPLVAGAVGASAGLAAVAAMVVARAWIRSAYSLDERGTLAFLQGFQHLLFATGIVTGAVAAAVAAILAPGHRVIHGLLAAVVCAVVGGIGVQGLLPSVAGCFPDISLAASPVCGTRVDVDGTWLIVRIFAGASAVPALVAAGVASLTVEWTGRGRDPAVAVRAS